MALDPNAPEWLDEARRLRENGFGYRRVAESVGDTRQRVYYWLNRQACIARASEKVDWTCAGCGETHERFVRAIRSAKSDLCNECRKSAIRETLTCEECGDEFPARLLDISRGRKFCSRRCYAARDRIRPDLRIGMAEQFSRDRRGASNPNFKTGSRVGEKDIAKVFNLKLKGEDCCRVCGDTHRLQLHHAIPRSLSRAARTELRNGIPLCVSCHMGWHRRGLTIYRDLFTSDEWAYISSVQLTGQRIEAWLDDRYPERPGEMAA